MNILQRYHTFQQTGLAALNLQSQIIETKYGLVEYAIKGNGPVILLSHGSFGGFDQGLQSVYFLENNDAQCISPSRFGYLRTPMSNERTPKAQARSFAALLDRLGIDNVWMLGLSAGGMAALEFALQFPDRCLGLIMISAISTRPRKTPPIRFMVEHVFSNEFLGWMLATYFPSLIARSTGDDYAQIKNDPSLKSAVLNLAWPPFAAHRRTGMLNDLQQAAALPDNSFEQIVMPTLILHGAADPFVPFETAEYLKTRIKQAKLLAFNNGGHLSFLIQKEKTKEVILEFIKTNSAELTQKYPY